MTLNASAANHTNDSQPESCKYLGVLEDPSTCFGYPSPENFCHWVRPAGEIALEHQEQVCLTCNYSACPIYQAPPKGHKIPPGIILTQPPQPRTRTVTMVTSLIAGCLVLVLMFTWLGKGVALTFAGSLPGREAAPPITAPTVMQQEVVRPGNSLMAPPAATQLPATPTRLVYPWLPVVNTATTPDARAVETKPLRPTRTPTPVLPTPGPSLETAFGPDGMYLLHQMKSGESINNLAFQYKTSVQAIKALNGILEGESIWPDKVIILLPGIQDAGEVSPLRAFLVEKDTPLKALAAAQDVAETEIRELNDLGPGNIVPAGRWLILPIKEK